MSSLSSFSKFKNRPRKTVKLSQEELVKTGFLAANGNGHRDGTFPLVMEPNVENVHLASWAEGHRDLIESKLLEYGTVLFRGFNVESPERFREVVRAVTPDLLDYKERAAPRREVKSNVFTSTEFPADQIIPMHHEMSYSHNWPTKIWFYCDTAPREGGRTPVTDDREIVHLLDPKIKERFAEKKVMYVRNYGEGVDLPWQEVFQTEDRADVEAYGKRTGMQIEWNGGGRLRTRAIRQVFATHPRTGNTLWFNHAHMFHWSNLPADVREALLSEFAEDELPRNALYGDGTPIESSILEEIRGMYEENAVRFSWQEGDILLVDNFLASHGRESFQGSRKILVAMAELYENPDI